MENNSYKILGIDEKQITSERKPEDIDFEIKMKFENNLHSILEKISKILRGEDRSSNKEDSPHEKISKIETKIQEMYLYMFAYMKIMTQQSRVDYQKGIMQSIEEDVRNMNDNLKKMTKIERKKNKDGTPILCSAYQILGIPDGDQALSDTKVERKTLTQLNMTVAKTAPNKIEEILDMLYSIQRGIWAYSKLNTAENRKEYHELLLYQRLAQDSKNHQMEVGEVYPQKRKQPIVVTLQKSEEGETVSKLAEVGRLVNRAFLLDEDSITQYVIQNNINGEISRSTFYSKIDMARLKTDFEYAEFVKNMLTDNTISKGRKHLGGYVGEPGIKIAKVDGKQQEILVHKYNPVHIAMCIKFQKEKRKMIESNNTQTQPLPPNGDVR